MSNPRTMSIMPNPGTMSNYRGMSYQRTMSITSNFRAMSNMPSTGIMSNSGAMSHHGIGSRSLQQFSLSKWRDLRKHCEWQLHLYLQNRMDWHELWKWWVLILFFQKKNTRLVYYKNMRTYFSYSSEINPCSSNPCENGGTCVNTVDGNYACFCTSLWSGNNCETG